MHAPRPRGRLSQHRRPTSTFATITTAITTALTAVVLAGTGQAAQASPAPPAPAAAGPAAAVETTALRSAVCGTWVLYQVSSAADLQRVAPQIKDALALPGVVGLSVRFPWNAVDLTGDRYGHPLLREARALADSRGKALSIRFMAGRHTPARVFDAGAAYYLRNGQKVPLPWSNATGDHTVFLDAYDQYVARLAGWSRRHGVRLLHLAWFGQDWAELNHGIEVRSAPGYSLDAWLAGHRELITRAADHFSRELAVELPLSGYGPLANGPSAALADHVLAEAGETRHRFFVQANGWGPDGEWGAPSQEVEQDFDRIWAEPVRRGLQMIQPDGYDWARVFDRLYAVEARYAEVYLPSFWQVPGPSASNSHNSPERIEQLEREVAAFADRSC